MTEDEQLQAYNLKPSMIVVRDATRAVRAAVAALCNENLDGAMKWAVRAQLRLEVLEARYPEKGRRSGGVRGSAVLDDRGRRRVFPD